MKIAFYTLGCKVNQYETQVLREKFEQKGFCSVDENCDFDIIIINSCTVTAESDRKTRQALNRFRAKNPHAVIVLTGCMVQAFSQEIRTLPADVIVGNTSMERIVELTERFLADGEPIFEVSPHERREKFNTPDISSFAERTRAYMKIEDGCDRYCTYCIIPFARGFIRSKPLESIKNEALALSAKGFSEVVLVGINLTSYGKNEGMSICDAVEAVCSIDGIKRVRLGSLEPDHISDETLLRLSLLEKFCPQFHLSLQSGCDETLKRMNRHYDTAFYRDLVTRIKARFPNAAITTDIMVGFAGETEEEFETSLAFLKEIGFAKSHVFAYSRRAGTIAYNLKGQVTRAEKSRRSRIMMAAAAECEQEFLSSLIGCDFPVLFETFSDGKAFGYTPNYSRVFVESEKDLSGLIKTVRITSAENGLCSGILVE